MRLYGYRDEHLRRRESAYREIRATRRGLFWGVAFLPFFPRDAGAGERCTLVHVDADGVQVREGRLRPNVQCRSFAFRF